MENDDSQAWLSLIEHALVGFDDLDDSQIEENMRVARSILVQLSDSSRSPNLVALLIIQLQAMVEEEEKMERLAYDPAFA
jgi:hypothetical protein